MSSIRKISTGTLLVFVTSMVSRFLGITLGLLSARILGPKGMGLIALATAFSIINLATFRIERGLLYFTAKFQAENRSEKDIYSLFIAASKFRFLIYLPIVSVLFFLSDYIAANFFKEPSAALLFRITFISMLIAIPFDPIQTSFQGLGTIKQRQLVVLIKSATSLLFGLYLLFSGYGVVGILTAYLISNVISTAIGYGLLCKVLHVSPLEKSTLNWLSSLKMMLAFCLPLSVGSAFGVILQLFGAFLIGSFGTARELGYYDVALGFPLLIMFLLGGVSITVPPAFVKEYARRGEEPIRFMYNKFTKYMIYIGLPAAVGLALVAKPLISLLYTPQFLPSVIYLQILSFWIFLLPVANCAATPLEATARTKLLMMVSMSSAALTLVSDFLLIMNFGVLGIAFSKILVLGFHATALNTVAHYKVKTNFPFLPLLKSAFATLIMALGVLSVNRFVHNPMVVLILDLLIGITVYSLVLPIIRGFDERDYKILEEALGFMPKSLRRIFMSIIQIRIK